MKTLMMTLTGALLLSLMASTASAGPRHGRFVAHTYVADYEDFDDHSGWDQSGWRGQRMNQLIAQGYSLRQIRRMVRARVDTRIQIKTQRIRARFGWGHRANRIIWRMSETENRRFRRRMRWIRSNYRSYYGRYQERGPRFGGHRGHGHADPHPGRTDRPRGDHSRDWERNRDNDSDWGARDRGGRRGDRGNRRG